MVGCGCSCGFCIPTVHSGGSYLPLRVPLFRFLAQEPSSRWCHRYHRRWGYGRRKRTWRGSGTLLSPFLSSLSLKRKKSFFSPFCYPPSFLSVLPFLKQETNSSPAKFVVVCIFLCSDFGCCLTAWGTSSALSTSSSSPAPSNPTLLAPSWTPSPSTTPPSLALVSFFLSSSTRFCQVPNLIKKKTIN